MSFQEGDRVCIRKGSIWYGRNHSNPSDEISGVIVTIYPEGPIPLNIVVEWDNGFSNHYGQSDLRYSHYNYVDSSVL